MNHGIPQEVAAAAKVVFTVAPAERAAVTRSPPEKAWGFEENHWEEDGSELNEEFVWCRDQELKLKMEGIQPIGYSNFR